MKKNRIVFGILSALALASVASASTLLTGETVESYFDATGVGIYAGPVYTLAPGTIASYPGISTSGTFSVTYTDNTITILSAGGTTSFSSGYTFNGIVFDVPNVTFTGATIGGSSTLSGFVAGDLAFSGQQVTANFDALTFNSGNQLVLDLSGTNTSATPEPASLILTGAGLVALGFIRRRRRA